MKRIGLQVLILLGAAGLAAADSWYSIDGFTLDAGPSIGIQVDDAESTFVGFVLDAGSDPAVFAQFIDSSGPLSNEDVAIVQAFVAARALAAGDATAIESIELDRRPTPNGLDGFYLSIYSASGRQDVYVAPIGPTPGGRFSHAILLTKEVGNDGRRMLDRVLDSITVTIEDAAG